jgi:hypothetical protein
LDDALLEETIRSMESTLATLKALRTRGRDPLAGEFDLVLTRDLARKWGTTKEQVASVLRANGAVQLPRTTQGGGVPALSLWAIRNIDHWKVQSARARVDAYHAAIDPLEI